MNLLKLFSKSFLVSCFVGITYLCAIEVVHWVIGYESSLAHATNVAVLYVLGIYLNYVMQRNLVFRSDSNPLISFYLYNFMSAALVSTLSATLYSSPTLRVYAGEVIESVSTMISLLVISPISFLVTRYLFKTEANNHV